MRIDGIDKNHPQLDAGKLRVWQIMLIDDFSRRRFLRYVTTTAITSRDIVEFECEVFSEIGVPHILYTDNGSEFKGYHVRAEKILNAILEDRGGYRHLTHEPNNPQATGKVEVAHQWAEKMDRFIGLAIDEGQKLTVDDLNRFADRVCERYNNTVHRGTGETPLARWHSRRVELRKLDPAVIQSALLADQFEVTLASDMTVEHRKTRYKVPGVRPFVDFVGQRVSVVVPHNIDLIFITLPSGEEYQCEKVLASADRAGEFRSVAESQAERLTKELRAARREQIKKIKAETRTTGEIAPVPHVNTEQPLPETNITRFPQAETVIPAAEINAVTPVPAAPAAEAGETPSFSYRGEDLSYWEAVGVYGDRFDSIDECKQFLLGLFPEQQGLQPACDIEAAIDNRRFKTRRLQAVS